MCNPFRKQPLDEAAQPKPPAVPASPAAVAAQILPLDFAPNYLLSAYLLSAGGPVDLERLKLDSPALDALREAGVKPIASAGRPGRARWPAEPGAAAERAGVYGRYRKLLGDLATQAAPAVRVRSSSASSRSRPRPVSGWSRNFRRPLVQQTLLPRNCRNWRAGRWRPTGSPPRRSAATSTTSSLPDGNLGLVEADVTGKGVPAALVMAPHAASCALRPNRIRRRPARSWRTSTSCSAPIFLQNVRDLPVRHAQPPYRTLHFANAGHDLPAECTGMRRRVSRDRHAAWADA